MDVGQQDHELIPADAGNRVLIAQHALQMVGDADEQLIAHLMAVAIVDRLEIVQVEKADGAGVMVPYRAGDGLLQTIGQ